MYHHKGNAKPAEIVYFFHKAEYMTSHTLTQSVQKPQNIFQKFLRSRNLKLDTFAMTLSRDEGEKFNTDARLHSFQNHKTNLNGFNCVFHLKQSSLWWKCIDTAIVLWACEKHRCSRHLKHAWLCNVDVMHKNANKTSKKISLKHVTFRNVVLLPDLLNKLKDGLAVTFVQQNLQSKVNSCQPLNI